MKKSASPFFVKIDQSEKINNISIEGKINITKAITEYKEDSYFQLGLIYAGDYRPRGIVRTFLPEWLNIVLRLSKKEGVGKIDFFGVSIKGSEINKKDSIRSIELNFKTVALINDKDRSFKFEVKPREKKVLGLWLRIDGDESKAEFETHITKLSLN